MSINYSQQIGKKITTRGIKKICIHVEDILYIQCDGDFSTLILNDLTHVSEIRSLRAFEEDLRDMGFIRISRNTLINGKYISKVDTNQGKRVVFLGEIELNVTKRKLPELRKALY